MTFHEIEPYQIKDNVFQLIEKGWMLVTAGTPDSFNTMTASWGGLGSLWGHLVSFAFIRPQRYTFQFMERASYYTLSFFTEEYRNVLNFCGTNSGRDVDKIAATGLTPIFNTQSITFQEARLVLECRKLYAQDIDEESFVDQTVDQKIYAQKDYHRMYIGEITRCLIH